MKKRPAFLSITQAEYVSEYKLRLLFSDGKENIVDFSNFLESSMHPEIRKFLDLKHFMTFTLENGDLMWGDFDIIFPIIDLYENNLSRGKATPVGRRFAYGDN